MWVVGLGGCICGIAGSHSCHLVLEIDRAVVGYFGPPLVGSHGLQEDIGTADIAVNDGVGPHQVQVVESLSYLCGNGDDLLA